MNIKEVHTDTKEVSAKPLFQSVEGTVTSLQILENGELKAHTTKVPALLVCVSGEVVFENEKGNKQILLNGDFVEIQPLVAHWILGVKNSHLLLFK
ncbi:MAG: hypothetical protein JNJ57_01675 [Saprospiraceae bacterium]|nr:hypothetical protein [Saprospiraceae bacterium]